MFEAAVKPAKLLSYLSFTNPAPKPTLKTALTGRFSVSVMLTVFLSDDNENNALSAATDKSYDFTSVAPL